jgi:hypothetical protein
MSPSCQALSLAISLATFPSCLRSISAFFADHDAALLFDACRLDEPHLVIGDRSINLRQVPVSNHPARRLVNSGLTRGWCSFQGEGPNQSQTFHFLDEGGLQIQSVPHQHLQEAAAQLPDQILEQSRGTGDLGFAILLKAKLKGMGKSELTKTTTTMPRAGGARTGRTEAAVGSADKRRSLSATLICATKLVASLFRTFETLRFHFALHIFSCSFR